MADDRAASPDFAADDHTGIDGASNRAVIARTLATYLRPHGWSLAFGFVALVFSSASLFAVGLGLSKLTDIVSRDGAGAGGMGLDRVVPIAYGVLCCYAVGLFFRDYLMRLVGQKVSRRLRAETFANLVRLDPTFFDTNGHGELTARLVSDTGEMERLVGSFVPNIIHYTLLLIGGAAYAVWLNPTLALIIAICIPLVLTPGAIVTGRLSRTAARRQDALAQASSHASEMLRNLKVVQAYGQQDAVHVRYDALLGEGYALAARAARLEIALAAVTSFVAYAVLALIIWYGGHAVLANSMSIGDLVAFIFYANLCTTSVAGIVTQWAGLGSAFGAAGRLLQLKERRSQLLLEHGGADPVETPRHAEGARVAFDRVGFAYPSAPGRPVVEDVAFEAMPGELVAIVGPSGSGKSTLFDLLQGFYRPTAGTIRIDDADIASMPFARLAADAAFVPQRAELFSGSIRDNICVGIDGEVPDDRIWQVLRLANADGFVRNLDGELDADLGHDAARLSGGQRQRLAIARALMREPRLLLLDEPTSALDAHSAAQLQATIDGLRGLQTTLLITHSLKSAARADRVALLIRGRLVDVGPHRDLLKRSSEYAALARLFLLDNDSDDLSEAGGSPATREADERAGDTAEAGHDVRREPELTTMGGKDR